MWRLRRLLLLLLLKSGRRGRVAGTGCSLLRATLPASRKGGRSVLVWLLAMARSQTSSSATAAKETKRRGWAHAHPGPQEESSESPVSERTTCGLLTIGCAVLQSWSINACKAAPGAGIGLAGSPKPVPKACKPPSPTGAGDCSCNNAWQFFANNTITSAMDGQCITAVTGHDQVKLEPSNGEQPWPYWLRLLPPVLPHTCMFCLFTVEIVDQHAGSAAVGDPLQEWETAMIAGHPGTYAIASKGRAGMCLDSMAAGSTPSKPCLRQHQPANYHNTCPVFQFIHSDALRAHLCSAQLHAGRPHDGLDQAFRSGPRL